MWWIGQQMCATCTACVRCITDSLCCHTAAALKLCDKAAQVLLFGVLRIAACMHQRYICLQRISVISSQELESCTTQQVCGGEETAAWIQLS